MKSFLCQSLIWKIKNGIETGIKGNADCLLLLNKGNPHYY